MIFIMEFALICQPILALVFVMVVAPGCNHPTTVAKEGGAMPFLLSSPAFGSGEAIPKKHTCDGEDVSPALAWSGAPANSQSFALVVDDPDAPVGTWVHWILFDMPASTQRLPEGVPKQDQLSSGARQGLNDFRKVGYGGPCPPRGSNHRYFFKLYALNTNLILKAGATKAEVEKAMQGKILAQAELMGRFGH